MPVSGTKSVHAHKAAEAHVPYGLPPIGVIYGAWGDVRLTSI